MKRMAEMQRPIAAPAALSALAATAVFAAPGCATRAPASPGLQVAGLSVDAEEYQNYGEVKRTESGRLLRRGAAQTGAAMSGILAEWRIEWPSAGCGLERQALAAARRDLARELAGRQLQAAFPPDPSCAAVTDAIRSAAGFFLDKEWRGEVPPVFSYTANSAVSWPFGLPEKKGSAVAAPFAGDVRQPVLGLSGLVKWRIPPDGEMRYSTFAMNYSIPDGRRLALADYIRVPSMDAFLQTIAARWRAKAGDVPVCGGYEAFLVEENGLSWSDASGDIYLKITWEELSPWLK